MIRPAAIFAIALLGAVRPASSTEPDAGLSLAMKRGCFGCHYLEKHSLAPSFRAIAERHRSDPEARVRLADKILFGGRGHWGERYAMSPQVQLAADEAETLVRWVLAQ